MNFSLLNLKQLLRIDEISRKEKLIKEIKDIVKKSREQMSRKKIKLIQDIDVDGPPIKYDWTQQSLDRGKSLNCSDKSRFEFTIAEEQTIKTYRKCNSDNTAHVIKLVSNCCIILNENIIIDFIIIYFFLIKEKEKLSDQQFLEQNHEIAMNIFNKSLAAIENNITNCFADAKFILDNFYKFENENFKKCLKTMS